MKDKIPSAMEMDSSPAGSFAVDCSAVESSAAASSTIDSSAVDSPAVESSSADSAATSNTAAGISTEWTPRPPPPAPRPPFAVPWQGGDRTYRSPHPAPSGVDWAASGETREHKALEGDILQAFQKIRPQRLNEVLETMELPEESRILLGLTAALREFFPTEPGLQESARRSLSDIPSRTSHRSEEPDSALPIGLVAIDTIMELDKDESVPATAAPAQTEFHPGSFEPTQEVSADTPSNETCRQQELDTALRVAEDQIEDLSYKYIGMAHEVGVVGANLRNLRNKLPDIQADIDSHGQKITEQRTDLGGFTKRLKDAEVGIARHETLTLNTSRDISKILGRATATTTNLDNLRESYKKQEKTIMAQKATIKTLEEKLAAQSKRTDGLANVLANIVPLLNSPGTIQSSSLKMAQIKAEIGLLQNPANTQGNQGPRKTGNSQSRRGRGTSAVAKISRALGAAAPQNGNLPVDAMHRFNPPSLVPQNYMMPSGPMVPRYYLGAQGYSYPQSQYMYPNGQMPSAWNNGFPPPVHGLPSHHGLSSYQDPPGFQGQQNHHGLDNSQPSQNNNIQNIQGSNTNNNYRQRSLDRQNSRDRHVSGDQDDSSDNSARKPRKFRIRRRSQSPQLSPVRVKLESPSPDPQIGQGLQVSQSAEGVRDSQNAQLSRKNQASQNSQISEENHISKENQGLDGL